LPDQLHSTSVEIRVPIQSIPQIGNFYLQSNQQLLLFNSILSPFPPSIDPKRH
jgi:hypothetical protein